MRLLGRTSSDFFQRSIDMTVSFRLLEELKKRQDMPKIIGEMVRVTKNGGKVCIVEMSSAARSKAEEAYIRLHKDSGDSSSKVKKSSTR
jgi:ubiquinone/menaquinone biosynthesis C-methylase UbiE